MAQGIVNNGYHIHDERYYTESEIDTKVSELNSSISSEVSARQTADTELQNKINLLTNYVTPEMFGAVGDGVTDDTNAVKSALEYDDVVMNKMYYISDTITIKNNGTVRGTGYIIIRDNIEGVKMSNFSTIDGVEIQARPNNFTGACLVINNATQFNARCRIVNTVTNENLGGYGIKLESGNGERVARGIFNVDIEGFDVGIYVHPHEGGWINVCQFNGSISVANRAIYLNNETGLKSNMQGHIFNFRGQCATTNKYESAVLSNAADSYFNVMLDDLSSNSNSIMIEFFSNLAVNNIIYNLNGKNIKIVNKSNNAIIDTNKSITPPIQQAFKNGYSYNAINNSLSYIDKQNGSSLSIIKSENISFNHLFMFRPFSYSELYKSNGENGSVEINLTLTSKHIEFLYFEWLHNFDGTVEIYANETKRMGVDANYWKYINTYIGENVTSLKVVITVNTTSATYIYFSQLFGTSNTGRHSDFVSCSGDTFYGDIIFNSYDLGLILKDVNGTKYRLTVDTSGNLSAVKV